MDYRASTDAAGAAFPGDDTYTMTFPKDALPARFAHDSWSVIAADTAHFRILPNDRKKYLINEESRPEHRVDGSLTLVFAAEKPAATPEGSWLPTPRGSAYRLTFRFYGPIDGVANGTCFPPPMRRMNRARPRPARAASRAGGSPPAEAQ